MAKASSYLQEAGTRIQNQQSYISNIVGLIANGKDFLSKAERDVQMYVQAELGRTERRDRRDGR